MISSHKPKACCVCEIIAARGNDEDAALTAFVLAGFYGTAKVVEDLCREHKSKVYKALKAARAAAKAARMLS
jgi:hypothetical protein